MTHENEFDDLARELHETRAQPRPEYAHELDRRAAEWLRERPRRRLPSLRIAVPAAAAVAAAAVIALAVSGDGGDGGGGPGDARLEVAVVAAQAPEAGAGADAVRNQREQELAFEGDGLVLESQRAPADGLFLVRYDAAERTTATVDLAGREAEVELGPGAGSIEISTADLPAGTHRLRILMHGVPTLRERVQIDG